MLFNATEKEESLSNSPSKNSVNHTGLKCLQKPLQYVKDFGESKLALQLFISMRKDSFLKNFLLFSKNLFFIYVPLRSHLTKNFENNLLILMKCSYLNK